MARTDVMVLGAGVVGASIALHLAKRGLSVALIDRQGPGLGTSYGNAGIIEGNTIFPQAFPGLGMLLRVALKQAPEANYHLAFLPQVAAAGEVTAGKEVKMVILPKFLGILPFDQAHQGALEAEKELKNPAALQFLGPTPENSVAGQIEIVTNAATQGVGAIMISNNSGDQIVPSAKAAHDKGIKVVTWDSPIPSGEAEDVLALVARNVVLPEHNELLAVRVGKRPQQHSAHQSEDRRARCNAESESAHDGERKPRTPSQPAVPQPDIGPRVIEPERTPPAALADHRQSHDW